MVPRGGKCPSCRNYVLWGDIVKGMYRRVAEGKKDAEEQEFEFDEETYGKMFESDSVLSGEDIDGPVDSPKKKAKRDKGKGKASTGVKAGTKRRKSGSARPSSSEGEVFDFAEVDNAEFSDDDVTFSKLRQSSSSKKTPTRKTAAGKKKGGKTQTRTPVVHPVPISSAAVTVPLFASSTSTETTPKKKGRKPRRQGGKDSSSEGEFFNFDEVDNMATSDDETLAFTSPKKSVKSGLTTPSPRKRRPPKSPSVTARKYYTLTSKVFTSPPASKNFYVSDDDTQSRANDVSTSHSPGDDHPYNDVAMAESTDLYDFSMEDRLVRTMTSLSVSSPGQVIVISD
ncbi:hypothetical protein D9758_002137 [Tetrapyrgos nigripes]|uniref:Uncharacterized protein n=1 Tax=Tetrapyrgos nigripes TaxID=182062 RepID=A0A8H5GTI5_9AGAR|nr:hypothetical protein D9758_002137 [Tetrapyrgos nigripes]